MRDVLLLGAFVCGLLASCSGGDDRAMFFPAPKNPPVELRYTELSIDTICLDSAFATSYNGQFEVDGEDIYFIDRLFCWIYRLAPDGTLKRRYLGQGRSNREIPVRMIDGYAIAGDGTQILMGGTRELYLYDTTFSLQHRCRLVSPERERGLPLCEQAFAYSLAYANLTPRLVGDKLFLNITAGSRDFNPSHFDYLNRARILMRVDVRTGKIDTLLGRYSPAIGYMTAFDGFGYDITPEADFYVGYEADSVIYVYDRNYCVRHAFGRAGRGIENDYLTLESGAGYKTQVREERTRKGYYTSIRCLNDYVFRTYQRNGRASTDGLQIYEGTVLVGDVDVPRGFRVKGYIAPYYYAEGPVDEENESLTLYRFTLE